MSHYVLDKAYRVATEEGVPAGAVVVRGAAPEECVLPAAANAAGVLGIATHAQPRTGRHVAVRRLGIAQAIAAGPIAAGARVCIADAQGRVAQVQAPRFLLGTAPANVVIQWRDAASFSAALEIELADPGSPGAFSWSFVDNRLRLALSADEEDITQTVSSLVAAVNGDAVLSLLVHAAPGAGATGSATLSAATAHATNIPATMNPIGIAETPATQAGDLVDVFLTTG